ncbi:protein of unknown function [Agreia sp. COWG]|nr:protein of unknown function [Agreia sp. COWG]
MLSVPLANSPSMGLAPIHFDDAGYSLTLTRSSPRDATDVNSVKLRFVSGCSFGGGRPDTLHQPLEGLSDESCLSEVVWSQEHLLV